MYECRQPAGEGAPVSSPDWSCRLGDTCSGERLQDAFGNAPGPLTHAEYPGRVATRIDLNDPLYEP